MIHIDVPEWDLTVTREQISQIPKRAGVYVLFDTNHKPLYVGIAKELRSRLFMHFHGLSNTAGYSHLFITCSVIYEEDQLSREIYELYLMNTLKTPINLSKRYLKNEKVKMPNKIKGNPESLYCHYIKADGNRCKMRAHLNGYCHFHGGNGISQTVLKQQAQEKFISDYLHVE